METYEDIQQMVMPQKQAWVYTVDRRVRRSKEEG
jgi:hypothetical protein